MVEPLADADRPRGRRRARRVSVWRNVAGLARAIRDGDDDKVEHAVLALSRRRRLLAPLALVVGAFVMLFQALRILVTSWRLTLVQVLPAMWIWFAMFDLKLHVLHGRSFHILRGPVLLVPAIAVVAITMASYFLNAAFAFAIADPGAPDIAAGFSRARANLRVILAWGAIVGAVLAVAALVVPRSGPPWFALTMSIVVGVMMFTYVAVPSRLLGLRKDDVAYSRRDRVVASSLGGVVGAVVCTPPYVLQRVGVLMLGSRVLFVPGIVLLAVGTVLQAGATGSVHAIKLSAKLVAHRAPEPVTSASRSSDSPTSSPSSGASRPSGTFIRDG
jgi:hypothetical protein